ncbi:MAG: spore coat biosynthesis protein F [Leptospiraceae bacterium]|nr:spore coat biosynthesis protein F [Leptospiraceae bacterium]MCP5500650.1 spore coat biosynthesis protein F [Leptospiraceae bacterium]
MPKTFAFIQARTGSSRLPGKVLYPLPENSNTSLLCHIFYRLQKVLPLAQIVLLIPEGDSQLKEYAKSKGYLYFEGSENNVRERYLQAALHFHAELILRLTGDNPFIDIEHISLLLEAFQNSEVEIASFEGLPLGIGIEAFTLSGLQREPSGGFLDRHNEHVSLHMKEKEGEYNFLKLQALLTEEEIEISNKLRLTIDEKKDYEFSSQLLSKFDDIFSFSLQDIFSLYRSNPNFFTYNQTVQQISFSVNSKKAYTGSIFLLYADPKLYGSGHYERCKLLLIQLQSRFYRVQMSHTLPDKQDYDLLIVDHRDYIIPDKFRNLKILLLDNFGPDRKYYNHFDILPHPQVSFEESLQNLLLPACATLFERKDKGRNNIFCYSGNMGEEVIRLDEWILQNFSAFSYTRIGDFPPKSDTVLYCKRISKLEYFNNLSNCSFFISYFGQSALEALYYGKKPMLFSISEYHKELTLFLESNNACIYIGDIHRTLSIPIISNSSHPIPSGEGFTRLLTCIDKILKV